MKLVRPPRPPQPALFIRLAAPKIPHGWRQYCLTSKRLDRLVLLDGQVALLPLAPRAGVELACRGPRGRGGAA